jgi:hypothetical protein
MSKKSTGFPLSKLSACCLRAQVVVTPEGLAKLAPEAE